MPLALDLISAFDKGWIFPVATTTRARSPRSTVAILDGSISWLGLRAALTPKPAPSRPTKARAPQMMRRRRFLPFLPFAKPFVLLDIQRTPAAIACHRKIRRTSTKGSVAPEGIDEWDANWSRDAPRYVEMKPRNRLGEPHLYNYLLSNGLW